MLTTFTDYLTDQTTGQTDQSINQPDDAPESSSERSSRERLQPAGVAGGAGAFHPDGFNVLCAYPSPAVEAKWLACLAHAVAPAHYASPAFFQEPYFAGKEPFAVLATQGGEVVGILTGLREKGVVTSGLETRVHLALDGRRDAQSILANLQRGVKSQSRRASLINIYSWHRQPLQPFIQAGYRKREFPGNPVLDLSLGPDTLLKQCNSKRRNCIRFAMKSGVEITQATTREEFDAFYAIYERWCAAKQIFQYSKEVEWDAFQTTQGNRRLLIARHNGQIIAGSVFRFFPGGLVEYSRNSSLPEFLGVKPNDLLAWRAIEWACENGFTHFSMGGNHRFLREFGGEMTPIDRYRLDRTLLRRHDLKEAGSDALRAILRRVPEAYEKRIRILLGREKPIGW